MLSFSHDKTYEMAVLELGEFSSEEWSKEIVETSGSFVSLQSDPRDTLKYRLDLNRSSDHVH